VTFTIHNFFAFNLLIRALNGIITPSWRILRLDVVTVRGPVEFDFPELFVFGRVDSAGFDSGSKTVAVAR